MAARIASGEQSGSMADVVAPRAFSRLHPLLPETHLLVPGQVTISDRLDPLLAELHLRDAVTLTDFVPFDRSILWALGSGALFRVADHAA